MRFVLAQKSQGLFSCTLYRKFPRILIFPFHSLIIPIEERIIMHQMRIRHPFIQLLIAIVRANTFCTSSSH